MLKISAWLLLGLMTSHSYAHEADVTLLQEKTLDGFGVTPPVGQVMVVEYGPGGASPKHSHPAHTFIYVLEGSIDMQVEGQDAVTLNAGDTFYERPGDIHALSRNASHSQPVKVLVFAVKEKGAALVVPVK